MAPETPKVGDVLCVDDGWIRRLRVVCVESHRVGVRNVETGRLSYWLLPLNRQRVRRVIRARSVVVSDRGTEW
jgi:hypothetical protein